VDAHDGGVDHLNLAVMSLDDGVHQAVEEMSRCLLKFSKRSLRIEIYAASAI